MAIKLKKSQDKAQLPAKLDKLLLQGFSFQQISAKYKEAFDSTKEEIEAYLEKNDDGFDLEEKTFKCDQGSVTYVERTSYDYDKDAIIELVNEGKVTIETLLSLATFPAEKLKVALGETNFSKVSTEKTSTYLTLKASAEFKEDCDKKFEDILPKKEKEQEEVKETKEAKKEEPKKAPKKDVSEAVRKAREAKYLVEKSDTTSKKSIDEDLAEILGE